MGVFLAGLVVLIGAAVPSALAAAAEGPSRPEETSSSVDADIAAIDAIVAAAETALHAVVSDFEAFVEQASTSSEVQAAAANARQQVTEITNEALAEVRAIEKSKPGALRSTADAARSAITSARDQAMGEIAAIQSSFIPPTPTTTLPTPTTTSPPEAGGPNEPSNGGGSPPTKKPSNGGGPSLPKGQGKPPSSNPQPVTAPKAEVIVAPAPIIDTTAEQSPSVRVDTLSGMSSSALFDGVASQISSLTDLPDRSEPNISISPQAGFTLAPALRALVASPLRVLRTVARVTVEGGRDLALPVGLLASSIFGLMLIQSRRGSEVFADTVD